MTGQVKIAGIVLRDLITILIENEPVLLDNWKDVGERLGFTPLEIRTLKLQFDSHKKYKELFDDILNLWMSKVGNEATIQNLILILTRDSCPYQGAADRLKDKYLTTDESSDAVNQSIVVVQEDASDTSIQVETHSGHVNGTYQALGNRSGRLRDEYLMTDESSETVNESIIVVQEEASDTLIQVETRSGQLTGTYQALAKASEDNKNATRTSYGRCNYLRKRWPKILFVLALSNLIFLILLVIANIVTSEFLKTKTGTYLPGEVCFACYFVSFLMCGIIFCVFFVVYTCCCLHCCS